jgi:hypothetical protein
MNPLVASKITAVAAALVASLLVAACDGSIPSAPFDTPPPSGELSVAYGRWQPGPFDTCSTQDHDDYATVGPDGKLYPTWHPPLDEVTGCSFGHEHGRDPRGSAISDDVGAIPFGYANERLDVWDPLTSRHEDHVGHKVEWENDVSMRFPGPASAVFEVRCNVFAKLHQGSHSKDAFTNNVHELAYHARCDDGTALSFTVLTAIGQPGEFVRSCDSDVHVTVGPPSPLNSPAGGGKRLIPDRTCIDRHMLVEEGERSNFGRALRESWQLSQRLRRADGKTLVSINPYFNVFRPSRYFDPVAPNGVGRPIDDCYAVLDGRRARGGDCEDSTGGGQLQGLQFDDPRSSFNGVSRDFDINSIRIVNPEGPVIWYTDPFGQNAQTEPFPGAIKQFIAMIDNTHGGANMSGPSIGRDRNHGGPGVHAPN